MSKAEARQVGCSSSVAAKVGLSIPEVMEATGLCRQTIYTQINSGELESFKVGRRRLVSPQALSRWVHRLETRTR